MNDLYEECNENDKNISIMNQNSCTLKNNITVTIILISKNT